MIGDKSDIHYNKCLEDLFTMLPKEQIEKILGQDNGDIDGTFIGFVNVYKNLSELIPKHFTVIDFGCAYNPQCFFFTEHKKYIAVDNSDCLKFKADNCDIYQDTIDSFIEKHRKSFNTQETFAICSYVPTGTELIRKTFSNLFVYYPHGGYNPFKNSKYAKERNRKKIFT